ncbi:hypothetical protein YC2023_062854 [Brassica napus]
MSGMNFISDLSQRSLCGRWVKVIKLWKQYSAAGGETSEMGNYSTKSLPLCRLVKYNYDTSRHSGNNNTFGMNHNGNTTNLEDLSNSGQFLFGELVERSGLEMDIRRSLNLLRGDFGTRRIGTIDCFKGIYTTRSKPLRAYLQDAICRGLSYGSLSVIQLIMVRVKVVKVCLFTCAK